MIFATIGDDCIANEIFRLSPSTFITSKGSNWASWINDQSSQVSQNENKNSQLSQLSIVKYQLLINFQFSQFSTSFNILSSVYLFSLFVSHLNFSMVQFVCCLGGPCASVLNWAARFSSTMPSEAAKKARTCLGEQRGCGKESTSGKVSKNYPSLVEEVSMEKLQCSSLLLLCDFILYYYTNIDTDWSYTVVASQCPRQGKKYLCKHLLDMNQKVVRIFHTWNNCLLQLSFSGIKSIGKWMKLPDPWGLRRWKTPPTCGPILPSMIRP